MEAEVDAPAGTLQRPTVGHGGRVVADSQRDQGRRAAQLGLKPLGGRDRLAPNHPRDRPASEELRAHQWSLLVLPLMGRVARPRQPHANAAIIRFQATKHRRVPSSPPSEKALPPGIRAMSSASRCVTR